jgi:uncharacterized protein
MLSEKPWKLDAVVRLLFGIFTCFCTFWLIASLLQQVVFKHKFDENSLTMIMFGTLSLHGSILVGMIFFTRWQNISWREAFGISNSGLVRTICWGLLVSMLFIPVGMLLQGLSIKLLELAHYKSATQQAIVTLENAESTASKIYLAFFAIVLAPVAEETLFRGVLYPTIKKYGGAKMALWATSLAFAAIHANLPIFLPLTVFAVALAWLYEKTDNLLSSIVAHSFFNGVNVLLLYYGQYLSKHP